MNQQRLERRWARIKILTVANRHRSIGKPYSMKTLQQAVQVCRQNKLIDGQTLATAGFNDKGKRGRR